MSELVSRRVVLFVASVAAFITPFMGSAINIALPAIGTEFGSDALLLTWVPTAYLLASAVFIIPFGRLADIIGRVRIFTWGIVIDTIGSFLSAHAPSIELLIAFRVIQGIGAAMIFGTGVALITSAFPPNQRGKAIGINVAAVYLGLTLGPIIGGVFTQQAGWRSIFYLNVVLGLIVTVLCLTKLRSDWKEAGEESFDLAGSAIFAVMLLCVMFGFSDISSTVGQFSLVAGCAALAVFVFWERRCRYPVVDIRLFSCNRTFTFSNLAALINYSATYAVSYLLSLYLQYLWGLDAQSAGLVLIAQPAVQMICAPVAGRISDKVEPRIIASFGMALTTAGLVLLTLVDAGTSLFFLIGAQIVLGLGFGFFSSPNTNAVMSSVDRRQYGVAAGTVSTMRLIGMVMSMGAALLAFSVFIGPVVITSEYFGGFLTSMHVVFSLFSMLCAFGVAASLMRGNVCRV